MPIASCPECEIAMEVKNFEDVLIDTCPSCRGVWLDRGELQKIIAHVRAQEAELSSEIPTSAAPPPRAASSERDRDPHRDDRRERDDYDRGRDKKKKKKRFGLWDMLEDLID